MESPAVISQAGREACAQAGHTAAKSRWPQAMWSPSPGFLVLEAVWEAIYRWGGVLLRD